MRSLVGVGVIFLVLAMTAARVLFSSHVELADGDAHRAAGDVPGAVDRYGRAARLYAPGSPFSSRAFATLRALGRAADDRGDRETALLVYREIRSAALATRSFYTPERALLDEANARIAVLAAALESPSPASPSIAPLSDPAGRVRWHAERLARDDAPSVLYSILALFGCGAFFASALLFIFRGLDAGERIVRPAAIACGLGAALGFALFLVGLARA